MLLRRIARALPPKILVDIIGPLHPRNLVPATLADPRTVSATPERNVSLRGLNTFGIVAQAAWFARATSLDDLRILCGDGRWPDERRLILGGGSNLVLAGDFDGLVVQVGLSGRALLGDDGDAWLVRVGAGESWHEVVLWTLAQGWPGLENLALIPGTCGAAPIQNIGAYGVELAERCHAVEVLDLADGAVRSFDRVACAFGYRDSLFKGAGRGRYVVTALVLRLPRIWEPRLGYGEVQATLAARGIDRPGPADVAEAVMAIRRSKLPDPAVLGNAGSFFKNPVVSATEALALAAREPGLVRYPQADGQVKLAAGWLIDRCGWKGRIWADGRCGVHERQALVLVNRGGASGADILGLAAAIRADVAGRFGVWLEMEPVVAGVPPT